MAVRAVTGDAANPDLSAAQAAAKRDGVLSAAELGRCGLDRFAIRRRVRRGTLRVVHPGVFTALPSLTPRGQMRAALLSCGEAWLCDDAAVYAWGLIDEWQGPVGVLLHRRQLVRSDISVRTTTWLPPEHRQNRLGLAVTSPARSLLDFGVHADPGLHEHAIAAGLRTRWATEQQLRALAATGRPGAPALRAHLDRLGGAQFSRSRAERILLRLCREARLPPPSFNERVHGRERDAVWHEPRVVAEFDGDAFHWSPASKRDDDRRDADLALRGWRTPRITWHEMIDEPVALAARLAAELAKGYAQQRYA